MPIPKPAPTLPVDPKLIQGRDFISQLASQYAEARLPKSEYNYIPLRESEIRLLRLHAAESSTDTIECSLEIFDLNEMGDQEYGALSYTWGTEEPTQKIVLRTKWSQLDTTASRKDKLKNAAKHHKAVDGVIKDKVYVRPNLEDVLRQFRNTDDIQEDLVLWIDAMCINQEDEKEKSKQVARMAEIYSKAKDVLIWLGKEYKQSNIAMDFIPKLMHYEQSEALISQTSNGKQWTAFADLIKREWFSRRWVVQEVALAKKRYVFCGSKALNWSDFEHGVSYFKDKVDYILALFASSDESRNNAKLVEDIRMVGATAMVDTMNESFRWGEDNNFQRLSSLEKLVTTLPMFESVDPRDTVFGLLSIAQDTRDWDGFSRQLNESLSDGRVPFEADYSKTIMEVFKDFTAFCVHSGGSLDIICRHWAPSQFRSSNILYRMKKNAENREKSPLDPSVKDLIEDDQSLPMTTFSLPSWIGLLSESPYGVPDGHTKVRRAGESLVGAPGDAGRYQASGKISPSILFGEVDARPNENPKTVLFRNQLPQLRASQYKVTARETLTQGRGRKSDGSIYVRGCTIDVIEQVSHRLFEGMIPLEWLYHGGFKDRKGSFTAQTPTYLWKTLVADREPSGHSSAPVWYHTALENALTMRNANGDLITGDLIRQGKPEDMVAFLQRARDVIWNRKFFLLERARSPRFGLGPAGAQKGDIICILFGCSVPVVLRAIGTPELPAYQLIGEAFMYDMMDGQALGEYRNSHVYEGKYTEYRLV